MPTAPPAAGCATTEAVKVLMAKAAVHSEFRFFNVIGVVPVGAQPAPVQPVKW